MGAVLLRAAVKEPFLLCPELSRERAMADTLNLSPA